MPRPRNLTPSYLLHRPSGQARVRVRIGARCRDIFLGKFGSPESIEKYHRVLAEHSATNGQSRLIEHYPESNSPAASSPIPIAALALRYVEYIEASCAKGLLPQDQRQNLPPFIDPLVQLYGNTPACEFGPKKLKAVRERVVTQGKLRTAEFDDLGNVLKPGPALSRGYVNALIQALVRMFKWAASEELVPASVHDALLKVDGLRKGKDPRVREPEPVRPVPEEHFWLVVESASPQIATMLQVQRLTGMRPDELTIIRPCDLDHTAEVWAYRPASHKLEWLNHDKEILIGPRAQELLLPWLERRHTTEYLFSPRDAAEANARQLEARRKQPSSKRVPICKARAPREHYDDRGYRQAVKRACRRAGVPEWSPGQLRHNAGTTVRQTYGAESAQLVLGHRNLSTTEIYAEKNRIRYEQIMQEIG